MSLLPITHGHAELRIRGRPQRLPAIRFGESTVLSLGRWLRLAYIHDEIWLEQEAVRDPEALVTLLKSNKFPADIVTFSQKFPDIKPRFQYFMESDNVAAIPLSSYNEWWEQRLPQESRKNTRKAAKQGIDVRLIKPDDHFVQGVTEIYNEAPVRQGKPFSKFGLDFAAVKSEVFQLSDRSDYIGAYLGTELVGFIKVVYMGEVASILSIVSKLKHVDKKPTNALIAKTVEVACERKKAYLLYGKYVYGNKVSSPLTEFKRRNGFEQVLVPKYYIPLTVRGSIALKLKLHRGVIGILPDSVVDRLLHLRKVFFASAQRLRRPAPAAT